MRFPNFGRQWRQVQAPPSRTIIWVLLFTKAATWMELLRKFAEGLKNLAQAVRDKGNLNAALHYFRQVVALEPNSGNAHTDLGYTLKLSDRLKEAEEELSKAVKLSPGLARAHFDLAEVLQQEGNSSAAL